MTVEPPLPLEAGGCNLTQWTSSASLAKTESVRSRAPQFCNQYCDTLQYLEKATCLNALLGCSSTKCGNASARYAPSLNMV